MELDPHLYLSVVANEKGDFEFPSTVVDYGYFKEQSHTERVPEKNEKNLGKFIKLIQVKRYMSILETWNTEKQELANPNTKQNSDDWKVTDPITRK